MVDPKPKTFFAGAALVWSRQRIVWLIYIVNFAVSYFAARATNERVGDTLNHSLASRQLLHGFSLGAFVSLATQPDSPLGGLHTTFANAAILFSVFMLFVTGGVLATYYSGQRLTPGPFYEACGHHFWRFVRLTLYLLLALIPIGLIGWLANNLYDRVDKQAISPMPSVHLAEAAVVLILFLLICIRVWFDMAQIIAVAEDERRMRRALHRSASLLRHNFGSLFWLYFRISLLAWILFAVGLMIWTHHLRPESTRAAFFVSQLTILFWLGTRLWQRACESIWFREHQLAASAGEPLYAPPTPIVPPQPFADPPVI